MSEPSIDDSNTDATTPIIKTPASASQSFSGFFQKESMNKVGLTVEIFKLNLDKEVKAFQTLLSENNYRILNEINSTASFWIKNTVKFPFLSKLARILINIKSSSSCVERYFSICGFNSKKYSSNIGDDLFTARCMLRANIDILRELNEVSY